MMSIAFSFCWILYPLLDEMINLSYFLLISAIYVLMEREERSKWLASVVLVTHVPWLTRKFNN